jgi:hypothetical protein
MALSAAPQAADAGAGPFLGPVPTPAEAGQRGVPPLLHPSDEFGAGGGDYPKTAIRACRAGLPPYGQISNSTPISMICAAGMLKYAPGRWALRCIHV